MSNQPFFHDYALDDDTIRVWPSEGSQAATIKAADFFAWLANTGYAVDFNPAPLDMQIATDTDWHDKPVFEPIEDWWKWPRVIHNPLKPIPPGVSLLDYLLHNYLADQCDGDVRPLRRLPEQFLTTEEKCRRVDTTGEFTMYLKNGQWWVKDHAGLFYTFLYAPICSNECPWKDECWSATVYKDDPASAFELEFLTAAEKAAKNANP